MNNLDQLIFLQDNLELIVNDKNRYTLDNIEENIVNTLNKLDLSKGCEFSLKYIAPLIHNMLNNNFTVFEIREILRFESLFYLDKFGDLGIQKISEYLLSPQFLSNKGQLRVIEKYLKLSNWQITGNSVKDTSLDF
jgi:hypothetical protein